MAQSRANTKVKESLRLKNISLVTKDDSSCDTCPEGSLTDYLQETSSEIQSGDTNKERTQTRSRGSSSISLRSTNKSKADIQLIPDVGRTGSSPTTYSNMKSKQGNKEEPEKNIDDDTIIEPKTRARKKASDIEEEKKSTQDEPKTSKEIKRQITKPKDVKNRPLGIRKTLRNKKPLATKEKVIKQVIKQNVRRGRKTAVKSDLQETISLIPVCDIKKEPIEETLTNSRSSSPKTAGRKQRVSSDIAMMKTMLSDSPSSLVLGPRTSPYSMRSERSNSPSLFEGKNLRSGKPRKVKNNLLNEVVMNEQKKRRRLNSDSKTSDTTDGLDDSKKLKRGRSCSRDGSEISKYSDNTESDMSMSETLNDTDGKELNKKLDKSKTDLDIDTDNNVQISTTEKVPCHKIDKTTKNKLDVEHSCIEKNKKNMSLNRSTSVDSDNNNCNRIKLENINTSDIEDKLLLKTDNNTLFEARSSILTSMSKTFNSKEVSKNIRKARRGRKAAASRPTAYPINKSCITSSLTNDTDDKPESLESLSKEITDLINNLDENIIDDQNIVTESNVVDSTPQQIQTKTVSKALNKGDIIPTPDTPVKGKENEFIASKDNTPSKNEENEHIRLYYEEDPIENPTEGSKIENTYKCSTTPSIDKLMGRLKVFEELEKRRHQQELECKKNEKSVMVTNDVVLIPKSGDIKPLKDIQSVRSPEKRIEKENLLSCFEHNSAISIVKRDQVRKSVDIDPSNSITLIKRNNSRKQSTSSNPSRESDAISIFEKSLGKDVTLTEIRKSVEKPVPPTQVDLNQFATLHLNNPQNIVGAILDPNQISITTRVIDGKIANEVQIFSKRKCTETLSRKIPDTINGEEKMATIEKIKTPTNPNMSATVSVIPAPVAVKSVVSTPVESEALPATLENITALEDVLPEVSKMETIPTPVQKESKSDTLMEIAQDECKILPQVNSENLPEANSDKVFISEEDIQFNTEKGTEINCEKETQASFVKEPQMNSDEALQKVAFQEVTDPETEKDNQNEKIELIESTILDEVKTSTKETRQEEVERPFEEIKPQEKPVQVMKAIKQSKSARNSIECQAGPSNIIIETPESQKHKENVLRTLGLLTHKAAKELKEKQRICSGMNKHKSAKSGDYTGTLKTVIKLNRNGGDKDKKKHRSSLKMTFQKSKYRGKPTPDLGESTNEVNSYYTIERREIAATAASDGAQRKSHYSYRLNTHDTEAAPEPTEASETLNLVIPEKASSFSIHPGRLCMDQCFYCGGKFGLFDTPCHIGQMKNTEKQTKVLDYEEKLTVDSCLCDACYRHVDRRANCPDYRKRTLCKQADALPPAPQNTQAEKPSSPPLEEESGSESGGAARGGGRVAVCHTEACLAPAAHSIRRKWLIKMRTSVNKVLKLKGDYPGLHTLPLCAEHYRALAPLMACVLCGRRLTKHHNLHFINHGYLELNPQLTAAGVPVQFTERPVLCKGCRYYCTLLQRPGHNDAYALTYRRKLLQIYNIELPPELQNEAEESIQQDEVSKQKKKPRNKSKQRKSTEPDQVGSESSERTSESTPEKEKPKEDIEPREPALEEDIESLISSNKILVPNAAKSNESTPQSDGSEGENICDMDAPIISLDKQTELQYLLQKQNNPAQFLSKPNLTQKHKHMKLQTLSGIQKPGTQHRISDKNAKRIHKLGQIIVHKDKPHVEDDDNMREGIPVLKNISLNDECTIESIPNKRPADINTLKNKWQMSESFTQVKKNISELSKNKDHKKLPEVRYSNPVKRLETNPSISVRELFPGEEEMNLQCNVDFNNVKAVTPEGWEKCNSLIQYDRDTKKLWNELQRPYGNQSSFLRHLIILEKYFRNGDLILSQNASPHAVNYSDSIQNRLRAYDNIVNDTPRRNEPSLSLIEFRKKPSMNGKSLLKSNQNDIEKEVKQFMPPPIPLPKPKIKVDKARAKQMPPELIAINTTNAHGKKSIQNVLLHNIQQLVKGVSASDPTEIAAAPLPIPTFEPPKDKREGPKKEDTPKKSKVSSKPWRPRLMPITKENLVKIANEPPQQAVDGRLLPSLVQVMSNGKRYHITLQDYNKMCTMRRDKLQQQEGKIKRQSTEDNTVITEIQPSAVLGNGGTLVQNITNTDKPQEKKEMPELQISSNAANILKNVGLKNITIAPIPPKTATVTSQTVSSPIVTSPSLLVTSNPLKIPQLGSAVTIVNDTNLTPSVMSNHMLMPKIPRSLTVIPQTVVASVPQNIVLAASSSASQPMASDGPVP